MPEVDPGERDTGRRLEGRKEPIGEIAGEREELRVVPGEIEARVSRVTRQGEQVRREQAAEHTDRLSMEIGVEGDDNFFVSVWVTSRRCPLENGGLGEGVARRDA